MKAFALKNCDTCRKALKALSATGRDFATIDVRADGLTRDDIALIVEAVGYEKALNRRSTTWRGLDDTSKADLDKAKAIELIQNYPTLMKRPALVDGNTVTVGWDKSVQQQWL